MAHVKFENVTVAYPAYNASSMTIKNKISSIATGGVLSRNNNKITIKALNDVSFELSHGDSVGLVGHNGAGKTTLLRTIAGIYSPSTGVVSREGKTSTIIELGAGLDSELSGYENIHRLGLLLGMSTVQIKALLPDIEDFTELGEFLDAPVRTYSSGMLMRLMFAVTTSIQPEILLVDEMFGTGDKVFQEKARARMENIISSSKIFVFASHSDELIQKFCNRIFKLSHGSLVEL